MSIIIPKSVPQAQIEPNTYIARCYQMIHLGTAKTQFFDENGDPKILNRVRITFELPTETRIFKEGEVAKPLVISKEYTLSFHEKSKLRPMLETWRGKKFTEEEMDNFDMAKLVGVPALITVITNEKGYAEISSITKPPKGTECPPQVNPSQVLDFTNWDEELFNKLPDFLKEKILLSNEYKKMKGTATEEQTPQDITYPSRTPF